MMPRKTNSQKAWEAIRQARLEATKEKRAILADRQRELRKSWKGQGRCSRCGSPKEDDGLSTCQTCLMKVKLTRKSVAQKDKQYKDLPDAQKERIKQRRLEKYQDRKAQGLCVRCGQRKALYGLVLCGQCRLERSQSQYGYVNHSIKWTAKERKAGRA